MSAMPPTKEEREALKTLGVSVPSGSLVHGSSAGQFGLEWDDIGKFYTEGNCPWCESKIEIDQDTDEDIECASCGKALRIELESAEIEFYLLIRPTITETDRKYLQARKEPA